MNIKFKRHYPLLILLVGFVLLFVLVFGDTRIIAYTTGTTDMAQVAEVNYDNSVDLFEKIYSRDIVSDRIDQLSTLFGQENAQRNLFDQTTYDKSVAHANEFLSQRKALLLSLELLDVYR